MNLQIKNKKKQFLASALAAMLSIGTGMSALSVAAPSVQAADAIKGSIMLDTANYIMAPGNIYDIGVTIKDSTGRTLSGAEVQSLYNKGKLKVSDSRTGSIANLTQLSNGNFRVTGKNLGTCYIVYEIGGTHASVRIDVQKGVKQHGTAVRNTSIFVRDVLNTAIPNEWADTYQKAVKQYGLASTKTMQKKIKDF